MYLNSIILGMIVLTITIYFEKKRYKEKGFSILGAIIGCVISLVFLCFPLYEEYSGIARVVYSVLYAIQILFLNEDFKLVEKVQSDGIINNLYIGIMYIYYLVAPLLTATAVLTLFGDILSEFRLRISTKTEYHIFSELNERTFVLADKILSNNKKVKIIFTNKDNHHETKYRNKKFLKIKETINELNLSKLNKKKYVYFMSANEEDNLNECLKLLDKLEKNDEVKIYLLNNTQEAYMIVDSVISQKYTKFYSKKEVTNEPKIKVEIINEAERITLQRLYELPIQNIVHKQTKQINVLIVGGGIYAKNFLNSIIWCFQMIGYSLKVIVIDKNIDSNICEDELLKRYDINIINENVETVISEKLLKNVDVNYAVVVTETDTNNFNIAVSLRRYFLRNNNNVFIDVLIQNDYRSRNIDILKNEKNLDYNLNTFGSIKKEYSGNSIINSNIEKMSKKLHLITCSYDSNFVDFYKSEYNRRSSRVAVVHIKYKLYSILQDEYSGNLSVDIKRYKELIGNEEIVKQLARNEHDRWMAYMFSDGYKVASQKDVENYYLKIGGSHKNTLAKLHPALVENDMLPKAEEDLANVIEKLTGVYEKKNFVEFDYDIVRRLDEIVDCENQNV